MLAPEVEALPWAEQLAIDDASYRSQTRLPVRTLGVLPRQARGCRIRLGSRCGGPGRHRGAAAHRQARAARALHARESDRRAPLRHARGDRPRLLHQRHDRHAQLRPAHGRRSRQLDHRLGAELRGLRHRRGPAHRLDLQRRAVRRGRGARVVRPHRALPHPGRNRQQRAPDALDRLAASRGRGAHAFVRRST